MVEMVFERLDLVPVACSLSTLCGAAMLLVSRDLPYP